MYNKVLNHLIVIEFDKEKQKFGTEIVLKLPNSTLHVIYKIFDKEEMMEYFNYDKKDKKTSF